MSEPSIDVENACLSYRHDYGIMPSDERAKLRAQAFAWHNAWGHTLHKAQPMTRVALIDAVRAYMVRTYGTANEANDRDLWHERLGMLTDFVCDLVPDAEHHARPEAKRKDVA